MRIIAPCLSIIVLCSLITGFTLGRLVFSPETVNTWTWATLICAPIAVIGNSYIIGKETKD